MNKQIDQIFIKWEVGEQQLLSMSLHRSGSINRAGDGSEEYASYFFMGQTTADVFEAFLERVDERLFEMAGRYTFPDPKGEIAKLTIAFSGAELDTGFEFTYGTESEGPPEEVVELVEHALELSHPWWEEQLEKRLQKQQKKNSS